MTSEELNNIIDGREGEQVEFKPFLLTRQIHHAPIVLKKANTDRNRPFPHTVAHQIFILHPS